MKDVSISTIIMFMLQALLSVLLALVMFLLTKIYEKLDSMQSKEGCNNFHCAHDQIHEMEKEQDKVDKQRIEHDINNMGRKINDLAKAK